MTADEVRTILSERGATGLEIEPGEGEYRVRFALAGRRRHWAVPHSLSRTTFVKFIEANTPPVTAHG